MVAPWLVPVPSNLHSHMLSHLDQGGWSILSGLQLHDDARDILFVALFLTVGMALLAALAARAEASLTARMDQKL
jgi:hypothetical protein